MTRSRRARGFDKLGTVAAAELGLPLARARLLGLVHAWRRLAGRVLASRLEATGIRRGTLYLEAEPLWVRALEPSVVRLAGHLAWLHPELGIRRVVLRNREGQRGPARAVVPVAPPPRAERPATRAPEAEGEPQAATLEERLERASRRYLERRSRSR